MQKRKGSLLKMNVFHVENVAIGKPPVTCHAQFSARFLSLFMQLQTEIHCHFLLNCFNAGRKTAPDRVGKAQNNNYLLCYCVILLREC